MSAGSGGEAVMLYRVEAPHFVAGLVVHDGRVVDAAPILKWAKGRALGWFRGYAARKGWAVQEVKREG